MNTDTRWGVCSTIKAPTDQTLRFVAHHLDAGAHRIWIYLDAPNPEAFDALKAHPKCRVIDCDDVYWRRIFGRKPKKHQVRQSQNATRTHSRAGDVEWLLHADVDEFIVPKTTVSDALAALPDNTITARVRPMEVLASDAHGANPLAFKKFISGGPKRAKIVADLFPQFGACLKGGFLSHVAGKFFVRTAPQDLTLRIHNVFRGEEMNPNEIELSDVTLAHLHAPDWASWRAHFDYRLEKGAYRSDLGPAQPRAQGGITLHEAFCQLMDAQGSAGLRQFFDEVCADTPELRERLQAKGLLTLHDLRLDAKLHHHFPDLYRFAASV